MLTITNSKNSGLSQFMWSVEDAIRGLASGETSIEEFEAFLLQAHQVVCARENSVKAIQPGVSEEIASELKLAINGLHHMRVGLERISQFLVDDNVDHLEVGHSHVFHGYELVQDSLNQNERKQKQFEAELEAMPKSA